MLTLFPEIQPYARHLVDVSDGHRIYVEESGNAQGIPVLFVHGGPGSGSGEVHRRYFDPTKYRIIVFDQRGCGQSTPHADLTHNNSAALLADMEQIRHSLGVEQWLLFGGSWGSTLSLLYAQTFPERCSGLILRGIFLCRPQDIHWFYQKGAGLIYPDYWQEFIEPIPEDERDDLVAAYYRLLTGPNEIARMSAAKHWAVWEARCSTLAPSHKLLDYFGDPHVSLAMARIEAHFFINNGFLEPDQLLRDAARIEAIPTVIVHGRYDMVCPIYQAFDLFQALPQAELHIVRDAGHSALEPGIVDNLIKATNNFALRLA